MTTDEEIKYWTKIVRGLTTGRLTSKAVCQPLRNLEPCRLRTATISALRTYNNRTAKHMTLEELITDGTATPTK